ncbi:hypothetical protein ED733_006718 [Metarhizium rileyi]|uniref:FAD linked oxidase N-terminal domain-containing protein n=1 Tax=Metarhizium rileyi (strain RCEF 4871) TaxID=1649241 RepID=A0A5C6GJ82_METRR|nr:hypothetical protein ED733_006718 [Metarhizium rileyi]
MHLLSFNALLLAQLGVGATTLTLGEVQAQIEAYREQERHGAHVARSAPQLGCTLACGFLAFSHPEPGKLSYPQSPAYGFEKSRYWSQQQALTQPACRFTPSSEVDVSLAVLTSRVTQCNFAVKSGGHAAFAGASNIEGGLTLDLRNLNQVALSADKNQTLVGAGNVWFVFADGTIRDVSPNAYSDLYWALRGGGNNFGIVTRFDLETYPQGGMWAGSQTFLLTNETATSINHAFYNLAVNSPQDPYAQIIIAYAYAQNPKVYTSLHQIFTTENRLPTRLFLKT